jgi:hypothetical protein
MHWALSIAILLAAEGTPESKRCPTVSQSLMAARTFSTLVGVAGCVTPQAKAFLVLLRARDADGFRGLAASEAAGAQMYGLCGLKHLHLDREASAVRKRLVGSRAKASIEFGDEGPAPMKAVSELVAPQRGQPSSEFDTTCDYLVEHGTWTGRRTCDPASVRLTCR